MLNCTVEVANFQFVGDSLSPVLSWMKSSGREYSWEETRGEGEGERGGKGGTKHSNLTN